MNDDFSFDDFEPSELSATPAAPAAGASAGAPRNGGGHGGGSGSGSGSYARDLLSKRIDAKFRTFFIDLKESVNGKFIKISEKSRGKKSVIMFDAEDVQPMIEALQEVQKQL